VFFIRFLTGAGRISAFPGRTLLPARRHYGVRELALDASRKGEALAGLTTARRMNATARSESAPCRSGVGLTPRWRLGFGWVRAA
jgi:hypothetical protein